MDPHLFSYMNYAPMLDPLRYMELQAQYLRLLAQFLADPEPSSSGEANERQATREQASASVQVEMLGEKQEIPLDTTGNRPTTRIPSEIPLPVITEVSPPPTQLHTEEAVPLPRRRAKNFDELPISAANKGFEALLEEELKKDVPIADALDAKPRTFLRKSVRNPLHAAKPQGPVSVPSEKGSEQEWRGKKPAPKEFLKRREGQLCMKKGQVSASPPTKNARRRQKSGEETEAQQSYSPDEPLGPPGVDVIERLRLQVESLSSEVSQLRQESASSVEESLNVAIEQARNEREQMRAETEARKRLESAEWRSQDKAKSREVGNEAEALKTRIRELQEEARNKEDAHRAAVESLRQQIDNLRKKTANGKPKLSLPVAKTGELDGPRGRALGEPPKAEIAPGKSEQKAEKREVAPQAKAESAVKSHPPRASEAQKVDLLKPLPPSKPPEDSLEPTLTFEAKIQTQTVAPDGKIQRIYTDGKKEVVFPNGVRKEVLPDGTTVVYFANKDVKTTYADGKVVYHFSEAQTTQTTYADKLQVFQFSNGQVEKHFPDGMKEIKFTDGTVKCIFPDGEEESVFPDGTVQKIDSQGVKYIDNVNGQKDTVYPDGTKVREYPDGSVKKFTSDGRLMLS